MIVKNNYKFPKYQYMGIFKLNKKDYFKLKDYYLSLNNKKLYDKFY